MHNQIIADSLVWTIRLLMIIQFTTDLSRQSTKSYGYVEKTSN